jgi:hypothetical protein
MNRNGIKRSEIFRKVTVATSALGEAEEICSSGADTETHRMPKMTKQE